MQAAGIDVAAGARGRIDDQHLDAGLRQTQRQHRAEDAAADHQHVGFVARAHSTSRRAIAASETGFAGARGANSGSPMSAPNLAAASGAQ